MPPIEIDEETLERPDWLRVDEAFDDEFTTELIDIFQAEELTLFHGGNEF